MTRMRTPLSAELRAAAISLLHKDPSVLRRQGPNNGGPPPSKQAFPKTSDADGRCPVLQPWDSQPAMGRPHGLEGQALSSKRSPGWGRQPLPLLNDGDAYAG